MRHKNKVELAISNWHREARGVWEFIPIVIPNMEAPLILLESINKSTLVFHDVFMLMAINIHTILLSFILPP